MLQKNIAANILMRAMKDKVEQIKKKNIIVSRIFNEKLQQIIEKYNHRHDEKDVYEILEALVDFKHELFKAIESGEAKDLTKTVKENLCPAWHERKQAQAKMRMKIKKLLKKYDYPPNKSEKAVEDVMEQVTLQCVAGL